MNKLTQFLVDSILNEDNDNLGVVALFGGGFKPPTRGHLEVVLQGLKENPEVKQIYILVGSGERNGVTQEEAIKIWEMYQKFIPVSSQIIPVQSPFSYIKTYLQDHPDEKVYQFIGARPDNPEDEADVAQRTAYAKKYSKNAIPVKVQTKGGVSGTMARKAALSGNNDEFITYFPSDLTDAEKQEIIDMISSVVKEQLTENASYSKEINIREKIDQLTQHMLDKGYNIEPLPALEFVDGDTENAKDFFGKTAYYDPNTQTIVLYTEGRHPKDIVRSYAHEMIHHIQNLEGRLGDITTQNTQEDDHLNDIEAEANLKGTMTFRNWTDSLQEGLYDDTKNFDLVKQNPFDIKKLTDKGIVFITKPGDGKGGVADPNWEGDASVLTLYNMDKAEPWMKVAVKNLMPQAIPYIQKDQDKLIYNGKYRQILWGIDKKGLNPKDFYLNENKVKDPFGLNAFAQELARGLEEELEEGRKKKKDPKKGTGKKPEGSGRRLYTDEDPKDTVGVSFRTKEDIVDTLNKKSFKAKSHARQSQVINLIHQRVRAAYGRAKDPETKARLKRGLDYIEKRKEASKKKTKRLQAQKENVAPNHDGKATPFGSGYKEVNEGRYDSLSRQLASIALNAWKSDFKDGAKYGYFEGKITPEEYPTDLTFTFKALGRFVDNKPYNHNGYSRADGEVGVEYTIPKDAIPQIWEEVYMDLISTIRHEIEHQTQGGKNVKKGKGMASDQKLRQLIKKGGGDIVRYVTLPKEIESNVQGLYLKAKKWRRPYDEVVDEYIKDFLKITNPADVSYVKNKWQEIANKRNLPKLLNEGRYDKFVNQLSRIAFEAIKDGFESGRKILDVTFTVRPPEDEPDIESDMFEFDFQVVADYTKDVYKVDGGANEGIDDDGTEITPLLIVNFGIPKNPKWSTVSMDLKDVVRHELEHLTQSGDNVVGVVRDPDNPELDRPGKQMADDSLIRKMIDNDMLPKAEYFKLEKEVDAMMQGLYFKAKKSRRPFKDVIDDYLATQPISKEEKEVILNLWRSRNKALNLPIFEDEKMPKSSADLFTIYLDMDGVIVDFDKQFEEQFGMPPREFENNFGTDKFWEKIDSKGVGFWRGMDWMPGGQQLYNKVSQYNHFLLSSPSRSEKSKIGKRLWRRDNTPDTKLILSRSYNKKNYADKSNILIDDRADNIQQWKDAGGIGILYQSADQVMKELDKLGL